jgi:pimeloyl-ACP methyl ester carboxylesterase
VSAWILLRGLTREARHWGEFPAQLAERLPGVALHCVDLPGNGRHADAASPCAVGGLLSAVRAELVRRRVTPPYHLLALSLGAMVTVEWCVRHPDEVAAAVLVNTSLRPFSPLHRRLQWRRWPALLRLLLDVEGDAAHEALVLRLTSRARSDAALLAAWVGWRRERRVARLNALRQLVAAARYAAPQTPPAMPLLVLAGAGDRLVDPRCSAALARAWGTAFALHPHAGHDLPLDDGPWLAEQVRGWCQASATASTPSSASI